MHTRKGAEAGLFGAWIAAMRPNLVLHSLGHSTIVLAMAGSMPANDIFSSGRAHEEPDARLHRQKCSNAHSLPNP